VAEWVVPLADVRLPEAAVEAAAETLRSGWLSAGPRVEAFEAAFAELIGVEHAVACSSGSAALELALRGAGVGPGAEVVLPSLNFVAAANVAHRLGASPVLVDIGSPDDLNVDPEAMLAALTSRTRAAVVLHYGGYPAAVELVAELGRRGVQVVEDCAHAPGARVGATRCGSWGVAGCFSFYANKHIAVGEGGMVTTGDKELAVRMRRLRSQGVTRPTWLRHRSGEVEYDIAEPGYNFRLDEPRAALGLALLPDLEDDLRKRAEILLRYRSELAKAGIEMPFGNRPEGELAAAHIAVCLLPAGSERGAVVDRLREAGIQTSVHYRPIHRLAAFRDETAVLPRTDEVWPRLMTLPLFGHMSEEQIAYVCEALARAISA
jgi:dTDP-4-amino-4,6-dideoxygalactose transaminase